VYSLSFLKNIHYYSINSDWLLYLSFNRYIRDSLLIHHQFPLWCPYLGGGFPVISLPIFTALHPLIANSILFGEVVGIKIDIVIFHVISVVGMFYLTRHYLKYSYPGFVISTLLVILNQWWFYYVFFGGNYLELWYFTFPLIFFFFLKSQEQKIYRITTALMLALMLLTVKFNFLVLCVFFILYIFLGCLIEKKWEKLPMQYYNLFFILIVSCLYAMVKLLPVCELINVNSRVRDVVPFKWPSYETISSFFYFLVRSLGITQIFLCLGALILAKKESLKWFIMLIFFAFMSSEDGAPFFLAAISSRLPVFRSMSSFEKYYGFFFIFLSALMSGKFLTLLSYKMKSNKKNFFIVLLCMLTLSPLWITSHEKQKYIFRHELPLLKKEEQFYQIKGINLARNSVRTTNSLQYFNIMRNIGTIDWDTTLPIKESSIPKYFIDASDNMFINKRYEGEVFGFATENTARLKEIAVNTIILDVAIKNPGKVIINQNFDKYWNTNKGSLSESQGLLCLELFEKGTYSVILTYAPRSFYIGLIISIASLFVTYIFITYRPKNNARY
jgi:hypothetical protein